MEILNEVIVKTRKWIPLIVGSVGLLFIFGCKKTSSGYQYQLGWNSDYAYVIKVQGIWDRSSYYVDGQSKDASDLGKIPVSTFELRRQAELFARTRALFAFQEAMEDYFNSFENNSLGNFENNALGNEAVEQGVEEESLFLDLPEEAVEEGIDESDGEVDRMGETNSESVDNSLETITQAPRVLIASNQEVKVFYEDPNQETKTPSPLAEETPIEPEEPETEPPSATPPADLNSKIKKTINFQQVYDKVDLKISLVDKTYTEQNDVEIVYLFSGKNLKQELASAFNVSSKEIELRK